MVLARPFWAEIYWKVRKLSFPTAQPCFLLFFLTPERSNQLIHMPVRSLGAQGRAHTPLPELGLKGAVGNALKWVPQKVARVGTVLLQKMQMFVPPNMEVVTGAGNDPAKPLLTGMVAAVGFLKPAACSTATMESAKDPGSEEECSATLPSVSLDEGRGAFLAHNIHPCDQVGITPGWEGTKGGMSKDHFQDCSGFISGPCYGLHHSEIHQQGPDHGHRQGPSVTGGRASLDQSWPGV